MALNFNETVRFLIQLEMITVNEDQIIPQPIFRSFLDSLKDVMQPREIISQFVVRQLFRKNTSIYKYIDQFLSNFNFWAGHYEFIPNTLHRYEYSGLRNFLIDLEFLYLDHSEAKYIIADEYSLLYSELKMFHQWNLMNS